MKRNIFAIIKNKAAAKTNASAESNKSNKKNIKPPFVMNDDYRKMICSQSYLGKKGYTLSKSILLPEDLEQLKVELTVKPETFGPQMGAPDSESAFPVFRENENKFYIPRFYGISRYGLPPRCDMDAGEDIGDDVQFVKTVRDYQEVIVKTYLDHVKKPISDGSTALGDGGILQVYAGAGKCLGKDTPILMFDGTIKLVQDIVVDDQIMGDDSSPRNVLSLARGRETMYKVQPKKGDSYIVNESHILSLKYSRDLSKTKKKNSILDISVLDYLNLPPTYNSISTSGRLLSGYRVPVLFLEKEVDFDQYLLGYWLGDGNSRTSMITTQEAVVIKYMVECFKTKHTSLYLKYTGAQYDYRINSINTNNFMMDFLRENNLIKNKHIPYHYKCNSREIQLAILAGLIDSDGYYNKNCYEIVQKNEKLSDDIVFLVRSIGFAAVKRKIKKFCTNAKGGPKEGTYFKIGIYGSGLEEIPVLCVRKKAVKRKAPQDALKYSFELEKLEIDDYYGFEIDGNRRFVLGDFTVTHNTVLSIKIISEIRKKTLILVHKEFLMNQWIERIQEFMPAARVGKIQGKVCDTKDKDIVIGMIQSIYDKDYPANTFSQFGMTIVDEVHRIGSEQFSKTLLKTVTPYMLGISATVDRKDKLTKVLYMFIGEKIYSNILRGDDVVSVRAIEYKTLDTQFNETEYDFRGTPQYSKMIVKLCEFGPRSDFIVRVIADLLAEHPENQIMILGHNRSLLTYLHDAIQHRKLLVNDEDSNNFSENGIATVGYYLGGMKPAALQATEKKNIVIATYAMAAEALDIKTLATLVMVTPKTDIIQSVGRILRTKHENSIIVDIVDGHDLFQNQWRQRMRYYKKCNYRIHKIDSTQYKGFIDVDWLGGRTPPITNFKGDKVAGEVWSNGLFIPNNWKKLFEPKVVTKQDEIDDDNEPKANVHGNGIGKCLISYDDYELLP